MDDHGLLELLFARVEDAIAALERRFGCRLMRTAMNLLESRQDAEECVSDTYMAIWDAIPPKRPEPLAPYVYKTGRNIALNRLRARCTQKRSGYELSLEELGQFIPAPDPSRGRELGTALNRWLSMLQQRDRVIFVKRYWFGDSVKEIAKGVGLRENAVSVRLHRLRNELKTYLTKEGYYD